MPAFQSYSAECAVMPAASFSLIRAFVAKREALTRYLYSLSGSRRLVDELLLETWWRISTGAVNPGRKVMTALYRTATHLWLEHLDRLRLGLEVGLDTVFTNRTRVRPETLERVGSLPEPCQAVFWLARFEALSRSAIAQRLGMPEREVLRHLIETRRLLAKA